MESHWCHESKSGEKIIKEFVGLRAKTYSYLIDDGGEDKKAKDTKMCIIKRKIQFEDYKNCLEVAKLESKSKHVKKIKLN